MKRLVSQSFASFAAVAFGIVTFAVSAHAPAYAQAPAPNFGSPPSGEVPILYNDQHVYTKPDRLKKGRVLAALIRGKEILVPLRSMFEQMGATVSYNASTKTVDVSKPGADVQVTIGKPEVVLNGETRPLDIPPEMYKGTIVVPVRVISEGMGAYVQWVPDKRLVVVRYLTIAATPPPATAPPTAPPTARPTAPPTAAPTAPPTPTPTQAAVPEFYVAGDALFSPKVYNEFSPGNTGRTQEAGRAGITFKFDDLAIMAEGDYRQYTYPHNGDPTFDNDGNTGGVNGNFDGFGSPVCGPGGAALGGQGCVTTLGPVSGQSFVPSFVARDEDIDGRIGIGIANPKIFIVGSYDRRINNYGYPNLGGFGGGLEKLPDFHQIVDVYGSILYYPSISGNYFDVFGNQQQLQYRNLKYQAGLTVSIPKTPVFLEGGYLGNRLTAKQNAPSNINESGFYAGIGLHF